MVSSFGQGLNRIGEIGDFGLKLVKGFGKGA